MYKIKKTEHIASSVLSLFGCRLIDTTAYGNLPSARFGRNGKEVLAVSSGKRLHAFTVRRFLLVIRREIIRPCAVIDILGWGSRMKSMENLLWMPVKLYIYLKKLNTKMIQ